VEGLESGDLDEVVSSVHARKDVEIISFQLIRGSSDQSSRGQSSVFGNTPCCQVSASLAALKLSRFPDIRGVKGMRGSSCIKVLVVPGEVTPPSPGNVPSIATSSLCLWGYAILTFLAPFDLYSLFRGKI